MSADTPPVRLRWNGDSFTPISPMQQKRCDEWFVIGEVYDIEAIEQRSAKSHRHYFFMLREIWKNLPHEIEGLYPSPEHLRKRGLIETGYYNLHPFVCDTEDGAVALKQYLIKDSGTEFDLIITKGNVMYRYVAKSQRTRGPDAMDKKTFQKSKEDVLQWASALIGLTPSDIKKAVK